jgi:RHS repeat-associated protein
MGSDNGRGQSDARTSEAGRAENRARPPAVSLPKGGGAIKGIGEKFAANPVTGAGSMTFPIATSDGRAGFGPRLSLSYDSSSGNGPFGFGWTCSLPAIARKTDRGLPRYRDREESDVFILSGAEDLVPELRSDGSRFEDTSLAPGFTVHRYRPRVEGSFARIERWTSQATGESHWRSISRDNVATLYGRTAESRIVDPADPTRIFTWLICQSCDDKGNAIVYSYAAENASKIDVSDVNERNRERGANRYLKRIRYGNRASLLTDEGLRPPFVTEAAIEKAGWLFEVVFDYDDGHYEALDLEARFVRAASAPELPSDAPQRSWTPRPDPFSSYRAGFEVRCYRRCRRVLMFHRFAELGNEPCLVRSTEFAYADLDYSTPRSIEEELAHPGSSRFASFIQSVTQSGFVRDESRPVLERDGVRYLTYLRKSLPPVEFEYSRAVIQDDVRQLDAVSLENLPVGLDGAVYRWIDLDGEGVSGILTEQGGAWMYKPSLGEGRFGPLETVASKPSLAALAGGRQQLLDLSGNGRLDLVALAGPTPGFYERTENEEWEVFREFRSHPNIAWDDPNLRFVDLTGDGLADVTITEDQVFTWYPSLADEGFGPSERVDQQLDEERGPRLVFADGTQSIYLADMCGDGLSDLVRIGNGEVCYWPNLGYGRFGARVSMDNAPRFENPDQFNQQRVHLADIDGSGTSDIIFLGRDGVRLYFNQSGNRWSDPYRLRPFPSVDNLASVTAVDLLGNGTACLVWSSSLPADARRPMHYIDLMGGQKPHLLIRTVNNLGAETRVHYASSSKFYLADKAAGTPWITKLPFPVHVVERVETFDRISRNRFVTRHAFHHGYFDGVEREFRGFGMVEQWDTEAFSALTAAGELPLGDNVDSLSHVPPVHTRTWFHTGVYLGRDRVSNFFAGLLDGRDPGEYYREPAWRNDDVEARKRLLDDTILPAGLSVDEEREACRALRGSMLRQEVYGLDGSAKAEHPYMVLEQNFTVEILQPRGLNRHAVFFAHPREAVEHHYERNHDDPRVAHSLTLDVDLYGNVLRSASVAYGRRQPDSAIKDPDDRVEQTQLRITCSENRFTNLVTGAAAWRTPLPSESRTYELTGLSLGAGDLRFTFAAVGSAVGNAAEISYEAAPTAGVLQKRLIKHARTRYRPDDLGVAKGDSLALLPLGGVESLAVPGESYTTAFTPVLIDGVYGPRVTSAMMETEGRYVHSEEDANWWIPSGRIFLSPGSADTPAGELAFARRHFFMPRRYRDPFHSGAQPTETSVDYDAYDLLLQETRDALGNRVTAGERDAGGALTAAGNDYRVLQPRLMMDANRNRSAVAFDALGMVVGTAMMAKLPPSPAEGDSLIVFEADLTEAEVLAHLADPRADPAAILRRATTRLLYDLFAYHRTRSDPEPQPAVVYTLARETHDSEPVPAGGVKMQHSFSYSDGFGREIQKKIQAEPGPVPRRDEAGTIVVDAEGRPAMTETAVSPRWVGTGWTVFNNKGKPVRQFEPFFTDTHRFERDVRIGVSPVLFYDPVGRVVATLHPNHTWGKVVFGPWRQETWDANDTSDAPLIADPASDPDVGDFFARLPGADYLPTWHAQRVGNALGADELQAARKSAVHAATPAVVHADSLGRAFLTIAHNKFKYSDAPPADAPGEELHRSRVRFDIEGNEREVVDAKGRIVVRYDYDMLGTRIHQLSMEAGPRWMLNDVAGKPLYAWNGRDHRVRSAYDALRRPTDGFLREGAGAELVVGRTVYGESRPNAEADNLRGKVVQLFDQAGVVTSDAYDFKGNLLRGRRQLAHAYSAILDWSAAVPLDAPVYTSRTRYDALNRPIQLLAPHSDQPGATVNVIQPVYNEANLLNEVHAWLNQSAEPAGLLVTDIADLHAVTNIDYDARGQRALIDFGNGVRTTYAYDPLTFRIVNLVTRRNAVILQDLHYTYDAVGNITHIGDDAQQTIFFNNNRIDPSADYTYDALYRLIEATGREHLGQAGAAPSPHSYDDAPRVGILFNANDGAAMGSYLERYVYDFVGNFVTMKHIGSDPANPGWTRAYTYREPSLIEAGESNRLTSTATDPLKPEVYSTDGDGYDAHGNMLRVPHLQEMRWDYKDQLRMTRRQKVNDSDVDGAQHDGERTWYVYDASGQRIRKVMEIAEGVVKEERIYFGSFEIFRKGGATPLVRETLHIMDDKQRIAMVESRTEGNEPGIPPQLIRFQCSNHLGSSSLELDDQARIISYEEYTPYGSTSYQAVRSRTEAPKRYRYTGKERDEESGLYYHGARYYAPWLGRWASCDPAGVAVGPNGYTYAHNNPLALVDENGRWPKFVDKLVNDPAIRQAASAAGTVAAGYFETALPKLSEKATDLVTPKGLVKAVAGVASRGVEEAREIHATYKESGGGAKGGVAATARALSGPVVSHAMDAMFKAGKGGGSSTKVIDAGVAKLAEDTKDINPLYSVGVAAVAAPLAASEALGRNDYRESGKQIAEAQVNAIEAAQAIAPVAGELSGIARLKGATPPLRGKTIPLKDLPEINQAAMKEYWSTLTRTRSFQQAGTALGEELGAARKGADLFLYRDTPGPGGPVMKEIKTTIKGTTQRLIDKASAQNFGYSENYQLQMLRETGERLVPIRITDIYDFKNKVLRRTH